MIKFMIEKGYLDINKVIIENYNKLNINEVEAFLIINLIDMYKTKQLNLSVTTLSKKLNTTQTNCSEALNNLLTKGLITINIEYTKSNKAKEVFDIEDLFIALDKLFNNEIKNQRVVSSENKIQEIIDMCEQKLSKTLSPYELELILTWIDTNEKVSDIQNALDIAVSKNINNLKYIDKILLSNKKSVEVYDEDKSKTLDDIFRNLK